MNMHGSPESRMANKTGADACCMSNAKSLCLNMIVKNEMANLERCLGAVADHINCWVIGDTGSTDGTPEFITNFFAARNIPGELHVFPFENFEQARNAALDCAYASPLAYDYLLLNDADMELIVEDRDFRRRLAAPSYALLLRSGGLSYWLTRLVRRDAGGRYHGVTHERLDVPGGGGQLHGVWYQDHATGSNRVDKFERDIRLLLAGLEKEPENHRYWFYLAQSYRDAGQLAKAAEIYEKRVAMGGWDEEAWYARLQRARCLRHLGDEGGFLREALAAYSERPQRAEPLYDLARFHREKGMHAASVLFSEPGLRLRPREGDTLFIEDFVYTAGLKEEYSIAAYYSRDPVQKERGFAACNSLALARSVPPASLSLARANLFFYLKPASAVMSSFTARPVGFVPPAGYRSVNPSVARHGSDIVLLQRVVNFSSDERGLHRTTGNRPVRMRNFLLRLDETLAVRSAADILPPEGMQASAWEKVLGSEDGRLFAWRDELWCSASIREPTTERGCVQALARIEEPGTEGAHCRFADLRVLRASGAQLHEKNWMPQVVGDRLRFISRCDPTRLIDDEAQTIGEAVPAIAAEEFRGGTQAIAFDHGFLALIHEVSERDKQRYYQHRFVWFDAAGLLRAASRPFFFQVKGVEFAAGLAPHPDGKRLMVSYGVGDREAWIATVDSAEVGAFLEKAEQLP
jgi:tetratricopeptide (TPR) repeat protein